MKFLILRRQGVFAAANLLSEYGLKHGMGHVFKRKYDEEHATLDENQITLFKLFKEENDNGKSVGSD